MPDGTTKAITAGALYDNRVSISDCIAKVLKARINTPDTPYPTDGSCGTLM